MEETLIEIYVVPFMSQEWIAWTLFSIVFISTPLVLARFLNKSQKRMVTYIMGISSLICWFLPFIKNKQKLFQFVFYTGIIGGFMAILTPQMNYFDGTIRYYLNYYVSHSLIIVMPIFMFLHLDLKLPRLSWFRLWINLNILMAIIMPINFLIGSNYMYVNEPPQVDNPLVIGDWPYYIFLWEIFILIIAYMVYSISRRKLTL